MMTLLFIVCFLVVLKMVVVGLFFRREVFAIFDRDPAARSIFVVIFLYPGLHAIVSHRIANVLWAAKIPFIPRMISQMSRFLTGIEIHPGAQIGEGFFIDHGMGVVVGETSVVGNNVTLFQGVTLGGTGKEQGKRHPNIGNNVVIGTGAKVLGNIEVGENSYIGANAVVIRDVPPNSTIVGVPGRITRQEGLKIEKKMDHVHVFDPIKQSLEELDKRLKKIEGQS